MINLMKRIEKEGGLIVKNPLQRGSKDHALDPFLRKLEIVNVNLLQLLDPKMLQNVPPLSNQP